MPLSQTPPPGTPIPDALAEVAQGRPIRLLWANEVGGVTGWISEPGGDLIAKWQPTHPEVALAAEAERLRWLQGRHPAPRVVARYDVEGGEVLVTEAIPAASAVDPHWQTDPAPAVRAIAEGLRRLHSLDPGDCPFSWGVPDRIAAAESRGRTVPDALREAPPVERLVVCHGDACAPNTLVGADGGFVATVDVGALGVGDRWADLAVATMSLDWNYDEYLERAFWDAYGLEPDGERIAYYRALWEAT